MLIKIGKEGRHVTLALSTIRFSKLLYISGDMSLNIKKDRTKERNKSGEVSNVLFAWNLVIQSQFDINIANGGTFCTYTHVQFIKLVEFYWFKK